MKFLVLVSFLGVVACRTVPLYPRIEEILRDSTSVEHLYNETVLLISLTEQLMTRMATSGRTEVDSYLQNIQSSLDSAYKYSTNRTSTIASYLLDDIKSLEIEEADLTSCLTIVPYITDLGKSFDDQWQVVFSTSYYTANTTLENKYTEILQNIAHVQGLPTILSNCNLDEECILDVANQVEEQNIALMNGLNDITDNTPALFDQILNVANTSAARTLYVDEEYICNVALIIENCIQSRIDTPIVTTTPSGQTTSPIPDSTTSETETTAGTTESETPDATTETGTPSETTTGTTTLLTTLNPNIYCTHTTFSL